ncbi:DUF1064 domain-containing protein [Caenibius sp. WL]|uniref:DUF1064 domain-containing protein n=1 Tax=Caenibius sp. WL TaxID=2872646 RepID=UPI001C99B108|nr:DUF1064 domain-containing protein [Caenibius sp. WL]QZP07791.1 DUF1064 domain-containing protein [Caenibius sp. WL]QZP09976.1 DUF1064 domain-containing protein [Caenibius sp. WL]
MTKYSAKRTACAHGHVHDSKIEAARCDTLHTLQQTGNISRLEMQPEFPIVIDGRHICTYRADFAYFSSTCRIVEDVKGVLTPVYRLKKKLVEALHGVVIAEFPPRKRKARKAKKARAAA